MSQADSPTQHKARSSDHGKPQPASQPMSKETAMWYVNYTHGQLQAFVADDGNWYLYEPRPIDPTIKPKVPITNGQDEQQPGR